MRDNLNPMLIGVALVWVVVFGFVIHEIDAKDKHSRKCGVMKFMRVWNDTTICLRADNRFVMLP